MKIVIDARMLGWSGIGRYSRHLLEELQKQDKDNEYLVLLGAEDYKKWQPSAANFHKVLSPYRPYSIGEQLGFAWQLYKLKPDLVHFLNSNSPVLYLRRRMATIHDLTMINFKNYHGGALKRLITWVKYWPMRFVLRCIIMRSRWLITPSVYVKKEILRHWGKDVFYARLKSKVSVTYESADKLVAKPVATKSLVGKQFLLFVGNAYPHKNLGNLVEAFRIMNIQKPELKLVLVGSSDSYYTKLANQVRRAGIKDIEFAGFANDSKLVWLYEHAQVFVFPSLSEGFGLPGLEAMQFGLPVAAAKASSLPEIYGNAAAYFDPHDPADIAQIVSELLDSSKLRQRLVNNAHRRTAEFSWQRMAKQTLDVYNQTTT